MNDEDKAFEAFRISTYLRKCMQEYIPVVTERFKNNKGGRFPYFQRLLVTDDKANKWMCLFYELSKDDKKRRVFQTRAYTTYEVPRRHVENDVNAGKGCIIFDPFSMSKRFLEENSKTSFVMDIVPHAVNRYTERYLIPNGKGDLEWGKKIENILSRWMYVDVCADLKGDLNAEKNKKDNLCPYDVLMRGGGMLRGQVVNEILIRFTTYVSPDMMFDGQLERQEEMIREYWRTVRYKNNIIK